MSYIEEWQFAADAYTGTGGFADGSELDKFKRESDGTVTTTDNAYGDRNLVCSCLPITEYEEK